MSQVLVAYERTDGDRCTGRIRSALGETQLQGSSFSDLIQQLHQHLGNLPQGTGVLWYRGGKQQQVDPRVVDLLRTDPKAALAALSPVSYPTVSEVQARLRARRLPSHLSVWTRRGRMECVGCGRWAPLSPLHSHPCGIVLLPWNGQLDGSIIYAPEELLKQPMERFFCFSPGAAAPAWIHRDTLKKRTPT